MLQCSQAQPVRERDPRSHFSQEQTELASEHWAVSLAPRCCQYFSGCCYFWWLLVTARYIELATFLMVTFTTWLSTTTFCFLFLRQYRQLEEDSLPKARDASASPGSLDRVDLTDNQLEIIGSSSYSWFINQSENITQFVFYYSYNKIKAV